MTPEQRKALLADLNHRLMLTAYAAARAIVADNDPALLPGLVWTLRHGRRTHNRAEAAYALGFMKGTEGTAALESTLSNKSEDTKVRAFAAETLAHRHLRRSHAVLLRNLQDPSREVRFWSAFALGQMREKKALPALRSLAESDNRVLQGWWAISKEAKDAIAEIERPTRRGIRRCKFCPYQEKLVKWRFFTNDAQNLGILLNHEQGKDPHGKEAYQPCEGPPQRIRRVSHLKSEEY